ncbi:hypothetical protein [Breznakiella homolactica]|uniref:Uncharacterized protein n=1 Tax=Breznakiella homolactica TaxID=2798577 RepID=A0A7T8B8M0_9SPIR|nr:hypothetical protein [Breznakiella homolactica]QQO08749.1 hypothetical protein JFL75_17750 [Breznakiella homolactica]
MDNGSTVKTLYHNAAEYQFSAFSELFDKLSPGSLSEGILNAYAMRGQIRLFAGDDTCIQDLEKADALDGMPWFPCLSRPWRPDSPNRFVVFRETNGGIRQFLRLLPRARKILTRRYGEEGGGMARQMESEIHYFLGDFDLAMALAEEQYKRTRKHYGESLMAQFVLYRCYLATGAPDKAERCMLDIVRAVRMHPECIGPYREIREWANITTGWSGDSPRFCPAPGGGSQPVLDDRRAALRHGLSLLSPSEKPFAVYAKQRYEGVYTMRQYYMDIFLCIHWFQAGDVKQAESHFIRAYHVAAASGLVMPFVEYGGQIIPLLGYIKENNTECPPEWISAIIPQAEQYEESLTAYRK